MREKRFLPKTKNNVIKFIADDEQLTPFVSRNQRERVRQMIESLLAKMLDGPLDDVPVVQLSSSEDCEYIPWVHVQYAIPTAANANIAKIKREFDLMKIQN